MKATSVGKKICLHQDETCGALRSAGVGGEWEIAMFLDTKVAYRPLFLNALFWGGFFFVFASLSFGTMGLDI
jgi:hypothetical protein